MIQNNRHWGEGIHGNMVLSCNLYTKSYMKPSYAHIVSAKNFNLKASISCYALCKTFQPQRPSSVVAMHFAKHFNLEGLHQLPYTHLHVLNKNCSELLNERSSKNECVYHKASGTLQQTTMMGTPRLQVRVDSPSGRVTPSPSVEEGMAGSSGSM